MFEIDDKDDNGNDEDEDEDDNVDDEDNIDDIGDNDSSQDNNDKVVIVNDDLNKGNDFDIREECVTVDINLNSTSNTTSNTKEKAVSNPHHRKFMPRQSIKNILKF